MNYVFSAFFFCLVFFLIYWYELFNLLSIWTVWYDSMIKQFRYSAFSMNKKMCLFLRNLFWANFVVNCNYFVYVMLLFLIYLETVFMSFEYSSNTCGSWMFFTISFSLFNYVQVITLCQVQFDKYFISCSHFMTYFTSLQVSEITAKYQKQVKYLLILNKNTVW